MPIVTIEEVKRNIGGLDPADTYFDKDIELYIRVATEHLENLIECDITSANQNIATLYIIVLATELFNHRELTSEMEGHSNKILDSLLLQLRY